MLSGRLHRALISLAFLILVRASPLSGQTGDSPWHAACGQVVAVVARTWESTSGQMICLQRGSVGWEIQREWTPVSLGRTGLGIGIGLHPPGLHGPEKREGDKRAPAGIFPLEFSFGTKNYSSSVFPYRRATKDDFWVDDAVSRYYNQWVRIGEPGLEKDWQSAETLRRADGIYDYAIVVGHNRLRVVPGSGSAIFMHAWYGPGVPTIGCTAMDKGIVKSLVQWLEIGKRPVLIQGPEELLPRLEMPDEVRVILKGR